jgi:hypothetical protein
MTSGKETMKIVSQLDILAGGPGSGCHGDNCGRPSKDGDTDYLHEKLGGQKGSNPGGLYKGSDGVSRYVKFYKNPAQGRGEALANTIYNDLGIGAPKSTMFETKEGKEAFASEIIKDGTHVLAEEKDKKGYANKVLDGFVADILVSNWDVVGLGLDNILIGKNGDAYRVDSGGTFLYRAQGASKPETVLNKITEWDGFFNPNINHEFSSLMSKAGYSSADQLGSRLEKQMTRIEKLRDDSGGWSKYVADKAPYLKGSEREKITKMLDSRTQLLRERIDSL